MQSEEQTNLPTTNLSETNEIDGIQPEEQQNIPTANLSGTSDMGVGGIQPEEQQNIPTANLSGTSDMGGGPTPEEQQNIPTANLSGTSDMGGNNNGILVSISPQKDPVAEETPIPPNNCYQTFQIPEQLQMPR